MSFSSIEVNKLKDLNPFKKIGKEWLLITAGSKEHFNTMTASWGNFGVLWNKNIATVFIRPQRYTFEFMEKSDYYTLSFFNGEYKKELMFCGRNSGKDVDKVKEIGFTPVFDKLAPYFKEAKLVFVCKKLYSQYINPKNFLDENLEKNYELHDYHKFYIGEIIDCLVRK